MIRSVLARHLPRLAFVFAVVGLILSGLAIWGERRAAAKVSWYDPLGDVQPTAIAPDLALLSLAGVPDSQVLSLALTADEMGTVRALLTFSAELSDLERVGGWMILAQHYQMAGRDQAAARAYRLVGYNVVLGPDLPDLIRVETLLAAGRQLARLHDEHNARFCLAQATLIAAYSRDLTAFHRRSVLERLVPIYLQVGGNYKDWNVLAEAAEKRISLQAKRGEYDWRASPGGDVALVAAQDARRAAASALREALALGEDDAGPKQALHQALLAEDAAVTRYATGKTDPAALETQLLWLLTKRQVAWGGFGDRLVPEWGTEAAKADIDAALKVAWQAWQLAYQNRGPADSYALVAAYWGLYPQASIEDLFGEMGAQKAQNLGGQYRDIDLIVLETGVPPVLGWAEKVP